MSGVLRIVEEGSSRLFLITDQGPVGARLFIRVEQTLQVLDGKEALVWAVPLNVLDWELILQGRGHWLECQGERVTREVIIGLR